MQDLDFLLRTDPKDLSRSAGVFKETPQGEGLRRNNFATTSPAKDRVILGQPIRRTADDSSSDSAVSDGSTIFREAFRNGRSFKVNGLERFWQPVATLHWTLENIWNYIATTTFIASGPGGSALEPHFDFDEVFALQIHGSKTWNLAFPGHYPSPNYGDKHAGNYGEWLPPNELQRLINATLNNKTYNKTSIDDAGGPDIVQVIMHPGDLLYIPRGTVHFTEANGGHGSAHITFGVDSGAVSWGWGGLAQIALDMTVMQLRQHAHKTLGTNGIPRKDLDAAHSAMERHLFYMSLTGFKYLNNSLPLELRTFELGPFLREGLPPGWLHKESGLSSSQDMLMKFKSVMSVFHLFDHHRSREASSIASTIRMLQLLLDDISLVQVLREAGRDFSEKQAEIPWGQDFMSDALLDGIHEQQLVKVNHWAVIRTYIENHSGSTPKAILEYNKKTYQFPRAYEAALLHVASSSSLLGSELLGLTLEEQSILLVTLVEAGVFTAAEQNDV